jgi:hypothetical protein
MSPTLAQKAGSVEVEDQITCNRKLLDRSDLFQGWLALWNEHIGELEISDFEEQFAISTEAGECDPMYCAPLNVYRKNNRVGEGDVPWTTLFLHSPDHARSIEIALCENEPYGVVRYLDAVRNQGWEINLSLSADVAGWLNAECFFVAGREVSFDKPTVWLWGRSPERDSETGLVAEMKPAPSAKEIRAFRQRLQPWLEQRFPEFRCWNQEFQELLSHVIPGLVDSLSMARLNTVFDLVLRDGEVDLAEAALLSHFFDRFEHDELAGPLRQRIEEFRRQHSDQLEAGWEPPH